MTAPQKLSVVVPIYNEEDSLRKLVQELIPILEHLSFEYEVILVDDGSTDNSRLVIEELCKENQRIKGILFRKNFGQTAALSAGFEHAEGDIIITLDADLQNDPSDIPKLVNTLLEKDCDIVSGWRRRRQDSLLFRIIPSYIANKIISLLTGVYLHDYGCTLKAYQKGILKNIKLYGEMHRFIPAIASWYGATVEEVEVKHMARKYGKSKYNLTRTFKVLLDLITVIFMGGFITKPIYFFGIFGLITALLSFVCIGVLIYIKLTTGVSMIQSPLLHLSAMLFTISIQFILLGLLAEISIRGYYESQNKPIYTIKKLVNMPEEKSKKLDGS